MRVILEVISGATAGRKVRLTADQELRVGRTEWADFAVPQDSLMSGVHFALRADSSGCYLTDLGSSNGTLVNGQPVTDRILLRDGDEIRAGETRFAVPSTRSRGHRRRPRRADTDRIGEGRPTAGGSGPCRGGVAERPVQRGSLLVGSDALPRQRGSSCRRRNWRADGRQIPLYLIVDFRKLGSPPPGDAAQRSYLFPWLPPAAAAAALAAGDRRGQRLRRVAGLVAQGWGSDAVVCLFSRQEQTGRWSSTCRTSPASRGRRAI